IVESEAVAGMRFDAVLDGERGRLGDAAKLLRLRLVVDMGIAAGVEFDHGRLQARSEEHTSELQSLMRISDAVFCLKKNTNHPCQLILMKEIGMWSIPQYF